MPPMSIFELIDAGDVAGVERLLADDPGSSCLRDDQGLSPVVHAAYRGRTDIVAVLPPLDGWDRLVRGESEGLPAPDEWSPDGFTALHLAAFAHNADAARVLLDEGADPNV